jgi:hypothetical protein
MHITERDTNTCVSFLKPLLDVLQKRKRHPPFNITYVKRAEGNVIGNKESKSGRFSHEHASTNTVY